MPPKTLGVKSIPAPTLVRLLDRMWLEYMSDSLQYGRNLSTARRIMFDNFHDLRIAVGFPEFKGSKYCIREMVRTVESLPMLSLMPDGCDVHDSRNYNKGTPEYVRKIYTMLRNSRQATPRVDEYKTALELADAFEKTFKDSPLVPVLAEERIARLLALASLPVASMTLA